MYSPVLAIRSSFRSPATLASRKDRNVRGRDVGGASPGAEMKGGAMEEVRKETSRIWENWGRSGTSGRVRTGSLCKMVPESPPGYQPFPKTSCVAFLQVPRAGLGSWHHFCFPEELRPGAASLGGGTHGERARVCPALLLACRHVFLISLFLGAMTSSPVILDTAIVRHSWKDWAWHSSYSRNELSWESQLVALA